MEGREVRGAEWDLEEWVWEEREEDEEEWVSDAGGGGRGPRCSAG